MTFHLFTLLLVCGGLAAFYFLLRWLTSRDIQVQLKAQANLASTCLLMLAFSSVYYLHDDFNRLLAQIAHQPGAIASTPVK